MVFAAARDGPRSAPPRPRCGVSTFEPTKLALSLAFAGGVSGGLFSEALEKAALAPSTWDPGGFASDLFLQRFVVSVLQGADRANRTGRRDQPFDSVARTPAGRPEHRGFSAQHPGGACSVGCASPRARASLPRHLPVARPAREQWFGAHLGREPAQARHPGCSERGARSHGGRIHLGGIGAAAARRVRQGRARKRVVSIAVRSALATMRSSRR